jgi:hypothetical protein
MLCSVERLISRWGEHGPRPEPLAINADLFASLQIVESVEVHCDVAAAWQLITDVTRIGEFSPECVEARWLDGGGLRVASRFEGTNRRVSDTSEAIWIRPCTVTAVEPMTKFAYAVGDRYDGTPSASWEFNIKPLGRTRCRIRQSFGHERDGLSGLRGFADAEPERARQIVADRRIDLQRGMRQTLMRMKALLESETHSVE